MTPRLLRMMATLSSDADLLLQYTATCPALHLLQSTLMDRLFYYLCFC